MTDKLRAAAEMALEALERTMEAGMTGIKVDQAAKALRQALAESNNDDDYWRKKAEHLEQENFGWRTKLNVRGYEIEIESLRQALDQLPDTTKMIEPSVGIVGWMYEDQLPEIYPYEEMFQFSVVDGVRMFPVYAPKSEPYTGTDRGAWDDVPDATKWVDELRGDEDLDEPEPFGWLFKQADGNLYKLLRGEDVEWSENHNPHWIKVSPLYTAPPKQPEQESVTLLPDGSAFGVMSFPLPDSHWLYAEREYRDGEHEPIELGKPILTHELRDAVISAVRYAIRGATNCGKEMDFDPDALVQNAVYALCGPYTRHVDAVNTSQECVDETVKCEQEPVAWMWKDGSLTSDPDEADGTWTKLYTAPPKREWQGLTDDEWYKIWDDANTDMNYQNGREDAQRMIEAKLKAKNGF